MSKSQSIIKLNDVRKIYQMEEVKVQALRGVDLEINKNEFVAIMGPSGSGKSTLLHMIGCLDRPSSGKIYLNGTDISKLNDSQLARLRGREIGFIFQTFNLYPTLTAMENVELPMIIIEKNKDERRKRALELLKNVGMSDRANHLPSQLSGGERQRVAIARALANDPNLILADEPTGNLDSKSGEEVMKTFVRLNESGKTVVVITHDQIIASHAKKVVKIRDGEIIGSDKK
ncbi:macrolide ABC transporter ATP-binding protein [Candidatus Micrarchaeota archaeon RBG_16_36_9]|nr:MAG: macrolide ABC transporter ATP-binding protein [Candidatus Micrarchaeota archaeon RBG_16_36_9]